MAINFNTTPYYDDFTESKNFQRILFKPGVAVQARELTQLQSALQNQIARFGQNIFKEGSIVIPGQSSVDFFYKYVKLVTADNSIVDDLVGLTVVGSTSGLSGLVLKAETETDTDPPTIYVKYLNSGTNRASVAFTNGETLTTPTLTTSMTVAASSATGFGTAVSVQPGVIFAKNNFVYFAEQTIMAEKYTGGEAVDVNKVIGFAVTESIVTSDDDESLLDPAIEANNYFAPGADRYKILLTLEARALTPVDADDVNYIELIRIEGGIVISQKVNPDYNIINDTMARRTYDESGNYTVRPYGVEQIEHLKTSNTSVRDGYLSTQNGGNSDLYVNIITPGKAYILGYEVENIKSRYLIATKARDSVAFTNKTISTETGNYVYLTGLYSTPDLATLSEVKLYNTFTATNGSASGTQVGTARIRSIEYYSGTGMSALYKAYLFDISMTTGYKFERDVKQIYYDNAGFVDFTANVNPTLVQINGTVATTNGSNVITGTGTRFTTELKTSDIVTINGNLSSISFVVNDRTAYASANIVGTLSGFNINRNDSNIVLTDKGAYIYEFPYSTIKAVDPTNLETSYNTKRIFDRTLSGGNVSITVSTDETFAPASSTNYIIIDKSDGSYVDTTGKITRSGANQTATFTLGGAYGSHDVSIIATIQKVSTAADKKTKTLVSGASVDFTANTTATATVLSLGKADVYSVSNIRMSANAFGTAFKISNAVDVSERYTIDNGQRKTHYDLGTLTLKPGFPIPTGPVRVYFDHFTHSAGDYFSVNSYGDIDYKDIPAFFDGNKTYELRDCLDFRPKINDDGTTFTTPSEFVDSETDLLTDYSYYVPRTDKIVIDSTGKIKVVTGISSLNPVEPDTPTNSMALFTLKQKAYVFDVKKDIDITVVDNRRFTMRDIGRIENRVKNLEYYTTLSLLEKDTTQYQIKDSLGFDRFKNGFVVDNFTGHRVGNASDPDYSNSMDFNQGILRPSYEQKHFQLTELNTTSNQRTSNHYVRTGNLLSLPYTSAVFIENNAASRVENINPFNVINFTGTIDLNPPSDIWFETTRLPDVNVNKEGNYDTLVQIAKVSAAAISGSTVKSSGAASAGTYGTVWGGWKDVWYGENRSEERTGVNYTVAETFDTKVNNDVVVNKVIIPKMRSKVISFTGRGLRPNTRVQAFFDNYNVTAYCRGNANIGGNVVTNAVLLSYSQNSGNLFSDYQGTVNGIFTYDSTTFKLPTGERKFRLTDSPTNGNDCETAAEAIFKSSGELRSIRNEIISTRNADIAFETVYDQRDTSAINGAASGVSVTAATYVNTLGVTTLVDTATSTSITYPLTSSLNGTAGTNNLTDIVSANANVSTLITTFTATNREPTYVDAVFGFAFGRYPDQEAATLLFESGVLDTIEQAVVNTSASEKANIAALAVAGNGRAYVENAVTKDATGYVWEQYVIPCKNAIYKIISTGLSRQDLITPNSGVRDWMNDGKSADQAAINVAVQLTIALLGYEYLSAESFVWPSFMSRVVANPDRATDKISNITPPIDYGPRACWSNDPLAETFVISGQPAILSKVDLFFYRKDNALPMTVEIRKVVNGTPTQSVVPFSRKMVYPGEISLSDNGQTATQITFDGLVYLEPGEYALVLLTSSTSYRVWLSQIGETDIFTNRVISEQPFVGVLFKSQNASTWTPEQTQDLKFRLYNAVFNNSSTGTLDLVTTVNDYEFQKLGYDPIQAYPGSQVLKVFHPNNGLVNGSEVKLTGFISEGSFSGVKGNIFGINVATINNVTFTVSNVTSDAYTIITTAAANVTSVTRGGGASIVATSDVLYDAMYPSISYLDVSGSKLDYSIRTVDSGYTLGSFTPINRGTIEFTTTKVLPSNVNVTSNLSGASPLVLRLQLSADNPATTPIIDMQQLGMVFIKNRVNTPTYATQNLTNDIITLASRNNIFFSNIGSGTGYISFVSTADKANVAGIVKGTTVTVSGSTNNNGTFRVVEVLDTGANIKVAGPVITEGAGSTVTVTNGINFIAEEAPRGGSALAKYITKEINLTNPSTSLNLRLDISKPADASVKVYFKTKLISETTSLLDKEYTEFTGLTIPTSLGDEFYEVEGQLDNLAQFNSVILKIVLLSTNSATVPKAQNLRLIALE